MSFECKYKTRDWCELRNKDCEPGAKGCVLKNKVKFVGQDEDQDKKEE